jgi:hypothetical protein
MERQTDHCHLLPSLRIRGASSPQPQMPIFSWNFTFVIYFTTLSITLAVQMTENNERKRMWMEAVVAKFKVLSGSDLEGLWKITK